jgi:hypothetical protein
MAKNALKTALKTALLTIIGSVVALFVTLSIISSNQAGRERRKQDAIQEFDRKNAEEAPALEVGVASIADRAKQAQRDLDADKAIANLRSSERDVLNEAIQKIQYYRACKAIPDLMYLLKESSDDYVAGIAAQTVAVCGDRSTFDTIVDQFLRRKAEPSMIFAVGETGTSDERVFQKLDKLVSQPNPEYEEVPQVARRAKEQLEMQAPKKSH